jgi:hypothetical protein
MPKILALTKPNYDLTDVLGSTSLFVCMLIFGL